jgi:streptomycin 6-kinase
MNHQELSSYLTRWCLILEKDPFQTPTSLIAKVLSNNQHSILKIAQDKGNERTASALKHYEGCGAVRLVRSEERPCF